MKTGFISGCFDGFHKGHEYMLKECCKNCDELWVSVNDDDYIRRIKKREPIDGIFDRIKNIYKVIGKQSGGFFVLIKDSPIDLIKIIKPDIIFCGDDYTVEQVVGHELAEVMLIKRIPGISTTERLKKGQEVTIVSSGTGGKSVFFEKNQKTS